MKRNPMVLAGALALLSLPAPRAALAASPDQASRETRAALGRGVVELQVTSQEWNHDRPWEKLSPSTRRVAAVMVEGRRLLTTAQLVRDATHLQLRVDGQPRNEAPRVVLLDTEVNLALLEVRDPRTLEGVDPVQVATATPTSGTLWTARWWRQRVEAASSRVERIQVQRSRFGVLEHAFVSMRTDLSAGGWGEPVFHEGKLVGITTSQDRQGRTRAIPAEVLREFLRRARDPSRYRGFANIGATWQSQPDPNVAAFLGLEGPPRGVMISWVPWGASACGVLRERDLILKIGEFEVDREGNFVHPHLGRLGIEHLFTEFYPPGSSAPLEVLRDGRVVRLEMPMHRYPATLDRIPRNRNDPPGYLVAGGLVLRELDLMYLQTWGGGWSGRAPLRLRSRFVFGPDSQDQTRRRVVLLTTVLPAPYNVGYHGLRDQVIERINGREVHQLVDAVEAFSNPQGGVHRLELAADSARGEVVLDAETFVAEDTAIRQRFGVRRPFRLPAPPPDPGPTACEGTPPFR